MTGSVENEFLSHLKSLYPASSTEPPAAVPGSGAPNQTITNNRNPWFLVAAVAYAASNRPDAVPVIFQYALDGTEKHDERLLIARQLREAIFKAGLIFGYSRAINALVKLHESMPIDLRDKETLRGVKNDDSIQRFVDDGERLFLAMYGSNASHVQDLLDEIHPDMGWFSRNIGYGHVYGTNHIVSQVETSYAIVSGLIAMDTPRQIGWHLQNCINGGATVEQAQAVRQIAMEVAERCGIKWADGVPEVNRPTS